VLEAFGWTKSKSPQMKQSTHYNLDRENRKINGTKMDYMFLDGRRMQEVTSNCSVIIFSLGYTRSGVGSQLHQCPTDLEHTPHHLPAKW
jgi:hypothetical protein